MRLSPQITALKKELDEALIRCFESVSSPLLAGPMKYSVEAGGKRIRPLILLLICRALGGRITDAMNPALALELLHTFTLVHDDIMDRDDLRRGLPTVHAQWDEPTAILAGDGLVTLAYQVLLKTEHREMTALARLFTGALMDVCEGQAMDMEFEKRDAVSMDEYRMMISRKTGRLFETACEMGAVLADAEPVMREVCRSLGSDLGLAFQIQDDLLDVTADSNVSGKPMGSDVFAGKKTFLFVAAMETSCSIRNSFFDLWRRAGTPEDIRRLHTVLERSGIIEQGKALIHACIEDARKALSALPASEPARNLASLVDALEKREF